MISKRITFWKRVPDHSGDFTIFTTVNDDEETHQIRAHFWSDERGNCGVEVSCSCGFEDSRIDTVGTNLHGGPHRFYKPEDFHNILGTMEYNPLVT